MGVVLTNYDIAVIGGGLVGAAIAYGIAGRAERIAVLDEGDIAYRASRGNFGLVWVQTKGNGKPAYGAWTLGSAHSWPGFARELLDLTGVDVKLEQKGGLSIALSEAERNARVKTMQRMLAQPGMPQYEWKLLDRQGVSELVPGIGPDVVGAIWCAHDGTVNSLKLFRALHVGLTARGVDYLPHHSVSTIAPKNGGFDVETAHGRLRAQRIVLAAGVGNARLAPMVAINAPVRPQRGQILALERVQPFLHYPILTLRQTDEGSVLIGDSQEETGYAENTTLPILATLAERAVRIFPALKDVRVVRTWAALRVMSKDGFPIYEQSAQYPGAFLATCHSGVTLAAAHARILAPAIVDGALPAETYGPFSSGRFDVQAAA
jgi:octopine oxidase subunit B